MLNRTNTKVSRLTSIQAKLNREKTLQISRLNSVEVKMSDGTLNKFIAAMEKESEEKRMSIISKLFSQLGYGEFFINRNKPHAINTVLMPLYRYSERDLLGCLAAKCKGDPSLNKYSSFLSGILKKKILDEMDGIHVEEVILHSNIKSTYGDRDYIEDHGYFDITIRDWQKVMESFKAIIQDKFFHEEEAYIDYDDQQLIKTNLMYLIDKILGISKTQLISNLMQLTPDHRLEILVETLNHLSEQERVNVFNKCNEFAEQKCAEQKAAVIVSRVSHFQPASLNTAAQILDDDKEINVNFHL